MNIEQANAQLKNQSPQQIIQWALETSQQAIVSTNFRPYEASILHATSLVKADIPVIWCDSGYNTRATYLHANELIEKLKLNLHYYMPKQTAAYRDAKIGGIPMPDSPLHDEFTEQVKLEPFRRALAQHQPKIWFTNLRKGQTQFRDSLDILTEDDKGCLKVSPFFYYTDDMLDKYLAEHQLPNEHNYFDPTKVDEKRECGLHTQL